MSQKSEYDCENCGACCCSFPIYASEADVAREPRIAREAMREQDHLYTTEKTYRLYPTPFRERCAFLKKDKLCRIYTTRPEICRRFEAGSPQCIVARQRQGIGS